MGLKGGFNVFICDSHTKIVELQLCYRRAALRLQNSLIFQKNKKLLEVYQRAVRELQHSYCEPTTELL